jgi:hypothetical protein
LNLRQQIVQDRVDEVVGLLGVAKDLAFVRFAHSVVVGQSIHAFVHSDLVEGGQDKQIDLITIEEGDGEATVYILSCKNTTSFESNQLIQMRNGLDWLFSKPRADVAGLANVRFRDKILEYRTLQNSLGPSNVTISAGFVTNGITAGISDEFKQEQKSILAKYDNGTFAAFTFSALGADELVARLNALERRERRIDADIRIRYDANNPSLIKYFSEDLKGLVCTASAKEIATIVNADTSGAIFDANIRRFLGMRGTVNTDITKTSTDPAISNQFWFLNNGITIVCESLDAVTDPDNPHVKLKNMQIVNGCQTATVLARAEAQGKLSPDVRVLLRIYESQDEALVSRIVLTTNNQNRISGRDLRSNDDVQVDMERGFAMYDYLYERKARQHDTKGVNPRKIFPNEVVAQSYLAVVLKRPSDARARKYKVWGELYEQVFGGKAIEPYIIATQIYRAALEWFRAVGFGTAAEEITRIIANNGAFHLARIAAYLWHGTELGSGAKLNEEIKSLDGNPDQLSGAFEKGFKILDDIVRKNPELRHNPDAALKSAALDTELSKRLHMQKGVAT